MSIKATSLLLSILIAIVCHGADSFAMPPTRAWPLTATAVTNLYYRNGTVALEKGDEDPRLRFERVAASTKSVDEPCILMIEGKRFNMTAWAKAHPGGSQILARFHGKDATKAFIAAGHSQRAVGMLEKFLIQEEEIPKAPPAPANGQFLKAGEMANLHMGTLSRVRTKLFTKEDPFGIHKYSGMFVLLHFAFRYLQTWFGDPSAGFGTRMGKGSSFLPLICLFPHTLLSLSSLLFHTVPRERIVGRPMIWQEFRVHNIIFGMRSIVSTLLAWTAIHWPQTRSLAVAGSSCAVLAAMLFADIATSKLRENTVESTTATMPYWEGCSVATQRRIKSFYAYSQFMATMACTITWNPAWPLVCLFPIQFASLLMTLVRKGLLSTKGYHIAYFISLCLPFLTIIRSTVAARSWEVPALSVLASTMFFLRRKGISKYVLWGSFALFRNLVADLFWNYQVWTC